MKRSFTLIMLFIIILATGLKAVDFSDKEKSIIYTNAMKVLENYQSIINRMGISVVNNIEKAKSDGESFLELFVNRQVLIFNDLDPSHKLSEFYEAETYSSNILLWYPDGLTISLDIQNAKVSDIMAHEENIYSIDLLVKKAINGNYLNQTLNKNTEELTFRVAFRLQNKTPESFKIVGIRNASSNMQIDYTKAIREVNSEEFSKDDMIKIQSELKTILQDYGNYLSLLGDPQESSDDKGFYKTSFLKLFPGNDTKVYNDISPEPQTSLISVADYLSSYITNYPNGIKNLSINADSAKFGKVIKSLEGNYNIYVDANKFFSGSYKGKDAFHNMFPLVFKISFSASGKTFSNFIINSIDVASADFYQAAPGGGEEKKPEQTIKPVTRKGFGISFIGSLLKTRINVKNITSMNMTDNQNSWTLTPMFGFLSAACVNYYFNDNIALSSGLEFNIYSSKYGLNGTFTDNALSTDVNGFSFNKVVTATLDSVLSIKIVTIPVLISYNSGKPGKFGFYGLGGFKVSIPVRSAYTTTGNYNYSGYFPGKDYGVYIIPYSNRQNIDETGKADFNKISLAFYASAGVNIPLGYYWWFSAGPDVNIGLTDIMKDKPYYDIFGKRYAHQPTRIMTLGLRVSLTFKL
jgi:hypothetical protein